MVKLSVTVKNELRRAVLAQHLRLSGSELDIRAAEEIEATANGHFCPPGEVETKFDSGRMALLCPTCRKIVGYARTRVGETS